MIGRPHNPWFRRIAAAMLLLLLATNVYRAATQSITVDEALTYNHFIAKVDPEMAAIAPFNNNLGTWLSKLSVVALGPSEFAVRLPSVLAGALYFYFLFLLCELLFRLPAVCLLAIAVNALNPFLLDYFSAARGYGLAIAFLTAGIFFTVQWLYERTPQTWRTPALAGLAYGLSIASHITALFPVAAILITLILIDRKRLQLLPMLALCAAVASLTVWPAMHSAPTGAVDGVVLKYIDGWKSLISSCLFYKPAVLSFWKPIHRLGWIVIPILLAGLLTAVPQLLRRKPHESVVLLFALSLPLMWLLLWIEPRLYHHGFFAERRLLATLPLLSLGAPVWFNWLADKNNPSRLVAFAGFLMMPVLATVFLLQANVSSYLGWEQDAASRQAMEILRTKRPADVRIVDQVGADPYLYESLNFYRSLYLMDWLRPVTQASPECTYDFYYVRAENLEKIKRFGVTELMRDPVAGTVLAEPSPEAVARQTALHGLGIERPDQCTADVMATFSKVANEDAAAERAMLRGFMPSQPGRWRWTFEHPALLMHAPKRPGTTFTLDFVLHSATFKETGPGRLTVSLNGVELGQKLYTAPEGQTFTASVPESALRADGIALIETQLDKYYTSPDDKQKMGYLFVRAAINAAPAKD